jgi:hypothetical protein
MRLLAIAARWEMITLVTGSGAITLWKLLQSGRLAGLLRSDDGTLSPGRIQMLMLTVFTAFQYLLGVMHDPSHMPALPRDLVLALGGSQSVYLGAKAWTIFGQKDKQETK